MNNTHFFARVVAVTLLLSLSASVHSTSVWSLDGIVDSTYGDDWVFHMVSTSDSLVQEEVVGVYLDNLSDGAVDINYLLNNPYSVGNARNGSLLDMIGTYNHTSTYFYVGGTSLGVDSMLLHSLFTGSYPLKDSAVFNHFTIDTSNIYFGTGRLDSDYNSILTVTDMIAVRTAVTPVPVPAAGWLFGIGLSGLLCLGKRKTQ